MSTPSPAALRLVITGGGTGGHVHPALAVVEELRGRGIPLELLWIGSSGDVEGPAALRAAIPFRAIKTGKLRRYFDKETFVDAGRLPIGTAQAWRILRAFRPDVIFSTGGFVSVPTVIAGARIAPILTHEQTAILGLATRINLRFADVLAISFERSSARAQSFKGRVALTGNPVRSSLRNGDAARARADLGFSADLPILYITGGARGATPINQRIEPLLPELLQSVQIIHQTGPSSANSDFATLTQLRSGLPSPLKERYHVTEFVRENLADIFAAADLVLCRAGAGTVAELSYLGKPGLLIPLPNTGGREQDENARVLADSGGAIVISQDEANPDRLRADLHRLLRDPERLSSMGRSAAKIARPEAASLLANELLVLSNRKP